MGKFKDHGDAELQLLEELAEMSQVIAKKLRFRGDWNEVPPGKDQTRILELMCEMSDVLHAYDRLIHEVNPLMDYELKEYEQHNVADEQE